MTKVWREREGGGESERERERERERETGGGEGEGQSILVDFTFFLSHILDWQRASLGHTFSSRIIRRSWICLQQNHSTSSPLLMKKVASPR
jgi:hypothetical protein